MTKKEKAKQDRIAIYNKFDGHCAYCGDEIKFKDMQADHIIPKDNFISNIKSEFRIPEFLKHLTVHDVNHIDNFFPSCFKCNNWKRTFDLELFRSELEDQVNRTNKYSTNYRMAKKYGLIKETFKKIVFYFEN